VIPLSCWREKEGENRPQLSVYVGEISFYSSGEGEREGTSLLIDSTGNGKGKSNLSVSKEGGPASKGGGL